MENCDTYRNVDDLGRIVIPRAIRDKLGISAGDKLMILADSNDSITLKLPERALSEPCDICGHPEGAATHKGKVLCGYCVGRERVEV